MAFKRTVATAAALMLFTPFACAQDSSWFGHWTLHRELSHLTGPSITIGRTPTGYHFDFGAVAFDVGDDGALYPTIPTRTTSIKPIGPNQWFRVHKTNGKEVDHGTLTVTADNHALLIHTVATAPDGRVHTTDERMDRIGAGAGLAGTWRSTSAGAGVSLEITIEPGAEGRLRWSYPNEGQFYVLRPDGVQVPLQGPRSAPNVTAAFRQVSPHSIRWTEFVNGQPSPKATMSSPPMADRSPRRLGPCNARAIGRKPSTNGRNDFVGIFRGDCR